MAEQHKKLRKLIPVLELEGNYSTYREVRELYESMPSIKKLYVPIETYEVLYNSLRRANKISVRHFAHTKNEDYIETTWRLRIYAREGI